MDERDSLREPRRKAEKREPRRRSVATIDIQRAAFLRNCRARIKPSDVGMPSSQRKRAEGLRREDVAVLSGVSVSWYTWLEQGRRMKVSDNILDQLCQALRLSEDERVYLYLLVQQHPPQAKCVEGSEELQEAPPDVLRFMHSLNLPAIVLTPQLDVLAWNAQQAVIFRDYNKIPVAERNLVEILFTKPAKQMTAAQFEQTARRIVARLRFDYTRSTDRASFDSLVQRTSARSPFFRRLWRLPEFTLRAHGLQSFTHERFGPICLEHTSFTPDGYPHLRIVFCTPHDPSTRLIMAKVNDELTVK